MNDGTGEEVAEALYTNGTLGRSTAVGGGSMHVKDDRVSALADGKGKVVEILRGNAGMTSTCTSTGVSLSAGGDGIEMKDGTGLKEAEAPDTNGNLGRGTAVGEGIMNVKDDRVSTLVDGKGNAAETLRGNAGMASTCTSTGVSLHTGGGA